MSLPIVEGPAVIIKNGGGLQFQAMPFCIFPWTPFSKNAGLQEYRNDLLHIYNKWLANHHPFVDNIQLTEQQIFERQS